VKIALSHHFDTTRAWQIIMKWAFALNAVLLFGIALKLFTGDWPTAIGIAVSEALVFGFTRLFLHYQSGSFGTLYRDRVEVEPNALLGRSPSRTARSVCSRTVLGRAGGVLGGPTQRRRAVRESRSEHAS
jgi:hypothetical protein